jgi:hypothetical protein
VTIIIASGEDVRPLPHLLSLGATGAVTAAIFFGIAFLALSPPQPAEPPADPDLPAQALEGGEIPMSGDNIVVIGLSSAPPGEAAARPRFGASAESEETASASALETASIPRFDITHSKRVRVGRHRREGTRKRWATLWRPDASAGPNPGGGFYTAPNINIGYINPRR